MKASFVTMLGVAGLIAVAPAMAATLDTEPSIQRLAQAGSSSQPPSPGATMGREMMRGGAMPMQDGTKPMQRGPGAMMQWGHDGDMPMGSGMMQGGGMMMGRGMMPMMGMMGGPDGMVRHMDGRIAFIKAELKITEAQEAKWNDFAGALRAGAAAMNEAMQPMMKARTTATPLPEQIEQHEKMLSIRLEGLHKAKTALLPLYAVLTEPQRQTADTLFLGPMGM